jgi:FtsP/CotA-like multicopper oxidase with cupredoxin domain
MEMNMSAGSRKSLWLVPYLVSTTILLSAWTCENRFKKGEPWEIEPAVARDLNEHDENIVEVELIASVEMVRFAPGDALTAVYTYNGTTPGPTIEAKVGDTLIVHFYNQLPEETTIHWHGLEVPANMDGSFISQNPVPPGGYFRYEFELLRPSLYWYHPHIRSHEQVEKGLYGALIVHDPIGDAMLGLPVQEHLLILDDILLDADGSVVESFPSGPGSADPDPLKFIVMQANGREGNTLLVNGQSAPEPPVVREGVPLRLRVVNTANSRFMRLSIPGHQFYKIGGDAGLLESPVLLPPIPMQQHPFLPDEKISQKSILGTESGLMLTPGERADIVFTPRGDEVNIELHDFMRGRHAAYLANDPATRYPPLPDYVPNPPPPQLPPYPDLDVAEANDDEAPAGTNHIPPPPNAYFGLDFDPIDGYAPPQTLLTLKVEPFAKGRAIDGSNYGLAKNPKKDYVPPPALRSIPTIDLTGASTITSRFGHSLPEQSTGAMRFFVTMRDIVTPLPFSMVTPADAPTVAPGETAVWQVINLTGGTHNFHLHGFMFEPLEYEFFDLDTPERNFIVPAEYREEKDTIQLPFRPGAFLRSWTITRLAVRFDETGREGQILASGKTPGPETSGGWLFHCHLLEHANRGMMSFLQVIDP